MSKKKDRMGFLDGLSSGVSNYVQTGWKVKSKKVESVSCSLVERALVFLEVTPRQKIELLMGEYKYREWLGYLVGEKTEDNVFFIEDLAIPPHRDSLAASAEAEPFNIPDRCVGIIHSHHRMGAFHSGIDDEYVDKNFPVSITVAMDIDGGLKYDVVSFVTTECGRFVKVDGEVKYVAPDFAFDEEEFMKEAKGNIDKGIRVYPHIPPIRQSSFEITEFGNIKENDDKDMPPVGSGNGMEYIVSEGGRVMSKKEYEKFLEENSG